MQRVDFGGRSNRRHFRPSLESSGEELPALNDIFLILGGMTCGRIRFLSAGAKAGFGVCSQYAIGS
jgi:hypothetical protein